MKKFIFFSIFIALILLFPQQLSYGQFSNILEDEDMFGYSITEIGDLNDDGFIDIVVGVPYDDDGWTISVKPVLLEKAKRHEKLLEFNEAAEIYKTYGMDNDVIRVRKEERNRVSQTVVQGDYVDDRDTIVKDSVLNRSNVGSGSSKMQELKDLTEMKKEGLIDDDEFKQMKKEILGK